MISSVDNYNNLIKKVHENDQNFVDLFSNHFSINGVLRYHDDLLKDMYDHNFSEVETINEEIFNSIEQIKNDRNEGFIKISCSSPQDFLLEKGFEKDILLTMLKEDYLSFPIPKNYLIKYKNYRENEEIINDIIATEVLYYGEQYGIDFCIRRWNRYFNKVKEGENGLNIFACYYQNNIAGYCYSFSKNGVVCIDSLFVLPEYRKQYVASNLIAYVAHFYNCPIYLHASDDDTPKEMYEKLGFKTISVSYDYLRVDKK